jgi:hypothetical protein
MAARLAALALLPSHVGQERISTFIFPPDICGDQRYQCKSVVRLEGIAAFTERISWPAGDKIAGATLSLTE